MADVSPPSAPPPVNVANLSLAMRQYRQFKDEHPGCVLFLRMGDFYEMFWDDARTCSRVLGVTLTSRNKGSPDEIPMAGVPFHAVAGYLRKMIAAGHRVALCEQMEDPAAAKGVVRRASRQASPRQRRRTGPAGKAGSDRRRPAARDFPTVDVAGMLCGMSASSGAMLDGVPKTYLEAIRVLAAAHAAGPDRVDIYALPDPRAEVVRLIEVSATFPEGGVERPAAPGRLEWVVPVFPMGRAADFPFRSEVVQVTPDEWQKLRQGTLRLNRDWGDLNHAEPVTDGK